MISVDLNCDLGEGMGNDVAIMPYISSANIACGFHAGDFSTISNTIKLALEHGVAIGAHPAYPDKENFGRMVMDFSHREIYEMITYQLGVVDAIAKSQSAKLNHVKPHGALYNAAAISQELASVIVNSIKDFDSKLILYGLASSEMIIAAEKIGLTFKQEVFADRTYQDDGTLTPRSAPNALIESQEECLKQTLEMIKGKKVTALSGKQIPIQADTICIHGDGKHAVEFVKLLNVKLKSAGINIAAA